MPGGRSGMSGMALGWMCRGRRRLGRMATIWETRDPAVAQWLGGRLRTDQGGAALFLDYGPSASGPGDSLQALRDGKMVDPLVAMPGSADLTAHVDFPAFAAAAGVPAHGPLAQGKFLARLGLFQRISRLAQTQEPRQAIAMHGSRAAAGGAGPDGRAVQGDGVDAAGVWGAGGV